MEGTVTVRGVPFNGLEAVDTVFLEKCILEWWSWIAWWRSDKA